MIDLLYAACWAVLGVAGVVVMSMFLAGMFTK